MDQPPDLTPEHFEILVVRELRKAGLEVSRLRIHRRTTLAEPERGYLVELKGVVARGRRQLRTLIACRRQDAPIGRLEVEAFRDHLKEADVEAGIFVATAAFAPDALRVAEDASLTLLRVADGRAAFDTSGWGTPGHYPAWLPAYCAQLVARDVGGQPTYRLLEKGQEDAILREPLRRE